MTPEEITSMAADAGFGTLLPAEMAGSTLLPATWVGADQRKPERFASLMAAREREACAPLLERMTERRRWTRAGINGEPMRPCEYATAIRNYPQIAWSDKCA